MATSSKGLKGVKRRANKNVSVSPLTKQDKIFLKSLTVETSTKQSKHGNAKAVCWNYYGKLMYDHGDGKKPCVLDDRLFCSLCLADIQKKKGLPDSATAECHISKISNFSAQTSTGNLNTHLSTKHAIETMPEDKLNKIVGYFRSYTKHGVASQSPPKQHEFNRDLVLWFCRDLMPFTAVNKSGFLDFFDKYMPMTPPSDSTLSLTALNDLYTAACSQVKKLLNDVNAVCVMLDGWTDRNKALSYNAIRVSFIKEWQFYVVTLSCEVLVHHTGKNLANEVNRILGKFFCDKKGLPKKKLFVTTCHDGAANVMKASRLLRSEHVQHCMGHCLHLLLSVDGLNTVGEIKDLLEKCRNIVTSLHFKGSVIDDEKASVADKAMIDRLSDVAEFLDLDEQFPLDTSDSVHVETSVSEAPDECNSSSTTTVTQRDSTAVTAQTTGSLQVQRILGHQTLKQFVCTRWNSNLTMISSILDLKSEVHNALLKTGNSHLCLFENELMLLDELHKFLEPFLELTELVSSSAGAVLSLQPMMKTRIKKLCQAQPGDDLCIQQLKGAVMRNIEKRLPVSDTVKIYQILDPETRTIFTVTDACKLLSAALARIQKRGCLSSGICKPRWTFWKRLTDLQRPPSEAKNDSRNEVMK
jgi:hypothetical protein